MGRNPCLNGEICTSIRKLDCDTYYTGVGDNVVSKYPHHESEAMCGQGCPSKLWTCTRETGHGGEHEGHIGAPGTWFVVARWRDKELVFKLTPLIDDEECNVFIKEEV